MRILRVFVALLVLSGTAGIAQGAIYKWIDAEGNVVYSETRPPGAQSVEEIEKRATGVSEEEAEANLEALRDKAKAQDEERDIKSDIAKQEMDRDDTIKKNCEIARENKSLLETPARVTLLDADSNNYYFLEEEQRQEKLLEAKSQVERYCTK